MLRADAQANNSPTIEGMDLQGVVAGLVSGLKPQKIILFGSRARGTYSKRSDLDLFVIQETDQSPLARIGEGLRHLPPLPVDVDIIVYTPQEVANKQSSPFIRRLLREGVTLYER